MAFLLLNSLVNKLFFFQDSAVISMTHLVEVDVQYLEPSSKKPFPSSPGPLYQNEVKCSAFDIELIFHSHANKTHFHKKGCTLSLSFESEGL